MRSLERGARVFSVFSIGAARHRDQLLAGCSRLSSGGLEKELRKLARRPPGRCNRGAKRVKRLREH